ncbi:Xaa-Pro peptidase family protein [Paenibacillus sp. YYML68]|uniref:M24 family metallopeptidase n=1 Tax=Paenibacillus sp. YYML68 TaxID=2909250 RepID=UPI0024939C01|nr:Xaa-Pro peptidase family protein [Paenibacillus sp. YYML68]
MKRLQQKLQAGGVDGIMMSQNVDLYYFTGSMQTGYLLIPADGEPTFFVRRSAVRAQQESAWPVEPLGSMREFAAQLARAMPGMPNMSGGGGRVTLAAEYDVLPVLQLNRLQAALPQAVWVDGSAWIRETRMIKSPSELAIIRRAAQLIDESFEDALTWLVPGMTELEVLARVELFLRVRGHLGMMRMRGYNQEVATGMLGAGEAVAMPSYFDGPAGGQGLSPAFPQSASRRRIQANEPILIDLGCCVDGYVIDQTRTVVIGTLSEELTRAYDVAEHILRSTEAQLRPGAISEQLYMESLRLAAEAGLSEHYMGFGADQARFLGHGIGLEIDELPVLARGFRYPLEPGMVLAIEPKFTFPGQGVVGVENSYAITESGYEKLTLTREGIIRL